MQLADKSGIGCDACGLQCQQDFVYYSCDFKLINIFNNHKPSLEMMLNSETSESMDVCANCFDLMKKKIVENNMKMMNRGKSSLCEWSGQVLNGTYDCFYCVVAKVKVRITGQPSICVKCQTKTFDKNKQCGKCSGRQFVSPAAVVVDNRFLEFMINKSSFNDMKSKQLELRNKPENQWTTNS